MRANTVRPYNRTPARGVPTGAEEKSLLERGHVITFEPGIYIEGRYGCRIEDMACIRPDGSFYDFTSSPKEMIELF